MANASPQTSQAPRRDDGVARIRAVTISREYGSGGGEVAQRLAARLGWQLVDHEVVAEACRAGVPKAGEVPREPRRPSAWRRPTALARAGRLWTETVRRTSLMAERVAGVG